MRLATTCASTFFPPRGYIIGAPKCGTTALAHYLAGHPQVAFSKPKEPHHFAADLPGLQRSRGMAGYRAFFSPGPHTSLLAEASVWYLYSQAAVPAILQARPDARFIVMLRSPVRMLPSLHRQLVNAFDEDVADFETAWRLSAERARGARVPAACRAPETLVYTRTAAFGAMLERLWQTVPREQTLVLFQEEMQADTGRVYRRALEFLGLPDDGRQAFPRVNAAKRARSRLLGYAIARGGRLRELASRPVKKALGLHSLGITRRLKQANAAAVRPAPLPERLGQEIARHYAEDTRRLAALLDRRRDGPLPDWLAQQPPARQPTP